MGMTNCGDFFKNCSSDASVAFTVLHQPSPVPTRPPQSVNSPPSDGNRPSIRRRQAKCDVCQVLAYAHRYDLSHGGASMAATTAPSTPAVNRAAARSEARGTECHGRTPARSPGGPPTLAGRTCGSRATRRQQPPTRPPVFASSSLPGCSRFRQWSCRSWCYEQRHGRLVGCARPNSLRV